MAVVSSIIFIKYFYNKYFKDKGKKRLFSYSFIAGFLSIITTIVLIMLFSLILITENQFLAIIIKAFIYTAIIPEILKLVYFYIILYKNNNFKNITDGIILSIILSLSFLCLENLLYSAGDIGTAIIRMITALPGHLLWSGILGYFIALSKIKVNKLKVVYGIIPAVIYHGLYNFLLFTGSNKIINNAYLKYLVIPLLIISFLHFIYLIKKEDLSIAKIRRIKI